MSLLLILVITTAGFTVCLSHPLLRQQVHSYKDRYLYLMALGCGLFCFICSIIINVSLVSLLSIEICPNKLLGVNYIDALASFIKNNLNSSKSYMFEAWMSCVSFGTLLMPMVAKKLMYPFYKRKHNLKSDREVLLYNRWMTLKNSPLDAFLYMAMTNDMDLMLTLEDRKVYVGRVLSLGEPSLNEGADQEIEIIPLISGYRDKDNLKVLFTTDYVGIGELPLVLRQDSITSVREFDFSVYDNFQSEEDS